MQYRVRTFLRNGVMESTFHRVDNDIENWLNEHGKDGYDIYSIERNDRMTYIVMVKYD